MLFFFLLSPCETLPHILRVIGSLEGMKKYPMHQLEFLSLKWAVVVKFHDNLFGTLYIVRTDNNPLTYMLTTAKLSCSQTSTSFDTFCYQIAAKKSLYGCAWSQTHRKKEKSTPFFPSSAHTIDCIKSPCVIFTATHLRLQSEAVVRPVHHCYKFIITSLAFCWFHLSGII